jgi:hypothetical protein
MTMLKKAIDAASSAVQALRGSVSEAVAQRVRAEACAKAYELMAQAHRTVIRTIAWQNGLLLLSLLPVYFLRSAAPFYVAYGCVAGNSLQSVFAYRSLVAHFARTRSVTATLSRELLGAIEQELAQRHLRERKVVQWLGPSLKSIADDVARKLKPDLIAAAANMAGTLLLSFVAFRLFVIPMLEHRALLH